MNRHYGDGCLSLNCDKSCHPGMGKWVPFCEAHWFALSITTRMAIFNSFNVNENPINWEVAIVPAIYELQGVAKK